MTQISFSSIYRSNVKKFSSFIVLLQFWMSVPVCPSQRQKQTRQDKRRHIYAEGCEFLVLLSHVGEWWFHLLSPQRERVALWHCGSVTCFTSDDLASRPGFSCGPQISSLCKDVTCGHSSWHRTVLGDAGDGWQPFQYSYYFSVVQSLHLFVFHCFVNLHWKKQEYNSWELPLAVLKSVSVSAESVSRKETCVCFISCIKAGAVRIDLFLFILTTKS